MRASGVTRSLHSLCAHLPKSLTGLRRAALVVWAMAEPACRVAQPRRLGLAATEILLSHPTPEARILCLACEKHLGCKQLSERG